MNNDYPKKIVELAGGQVSLAVKLKVIVPSSKISQGHIWNWLNRENQVPAEWVLPCCQALDWQVTPNQLRPDLYPHPHDGLPESMRQVA